jgi:hypothetical protein
MSNTHILPHWIRVAYDCLSSHLEAGADGIDRERGCEILLAGDTPVNSPEDATIAIDRLLDSGWLYPVDGTLYRTAKEPN